MKVFYTGIGANPNGIQRLPVGLVYFHPYGLPVSRQIPDAEPLESGACERLHTPSEFLKIMNDNFTHRIWRDGIIRSFVAHTTFGKSSGSASEQALLGPTELSVIPREIHPSLQYKDWILPDDFFIFSFDDWIDYSGASLEEN